MNLDDLIYFEVKLTVRNVLNTLKFVVSFTPTMGNQGKISGPLLDRIEMQIQVGALAHEDLLKQSTSESSEQVATRVAHASTRQLARQGKHNNLLSGSEMERHCKPDAAGEQLLRTAMTRLNWSARAYHRVLKVARTIADLSNAATISQVHVAEAIQYRRALREQ